MPTFSSIFSVVSSISSSRGLVPAAVRASGGLRRRCLASMATATLALGFAAPPVHAADMPFLGEMMVVGFDYCPNGWTQANGQLLSIAQNSALFALLGTRFGGNGQTNFGLPDLRSRVPVGVGQGPGLSNIILGEASGLESVQLLTTQMPAHTHATSTPTSTAPATHATPGSGRVLAQTMNGAAYAAASVDSTVGATTSGSAGNGQPIDVRNPYLGMTWCIALQGIFPSRP